MPKFANYVHLTNPETGLVERFAPGDDVPEWAETTVDPNNFASEIEDEEEDSNEGYNALSEKELKAMLKERDLPFSGTRKQMIARLVKDDASGS